MEFLYSLAEIIGVIFVSAAFFYLVNNYVQVNLKHTCAGSGTQVAADGNCSNLPWRWVFGLEM